MTECVFCDPEKIRERTIATFGNINIVVTFGQITQGGYLLLIPTNHVTCLGAMDREQIEALDRYAHMITIILNHEYRSPVTIFEHGIVGQTVNHAHLHVLPVILNLYERIHGDFPESEIQTVDNIAELQTLYQMRQEPYLMWSTTAGKMCVCWNPPAPAQYLRILAAEWLGVPERADWKKMDPGLDNVLIGETIRRLSPYFI